MVAQSLKTRDPVFDIMKGIAMLLVIASHTFPSASSPFAFWRSAMFFIISGYFAKEWPVNEFVRKGAKRLIIPYMFTCLLMIPLVFVGERIFDVYVMSNVFKSMALGASAFGYADKWNEINIGPLWFVCASIWVRFFWGFLQRIKKVYVRGGVIVLLAVVSYKMKETCINPWSIFSAFGALGFFFAGYAARKYDLLNSENGKRILPIISLVLIYCMSFSKMDINVGVYERGYILGLVASIAAFMLLYAVVQKFADVKFYPWRFLNFFGRYSLVVFCFHAMDQCINVHWFPLKIWSYFITEFELLCAFVIRVGIVAFGAFLVSKNKFLREKIFFIN